MPDLRKLLQTNDLIIFDGGYGTLLQSRGMPAGISPELFGMHSPEAVRSVHQDYVNAGAMALTTNTFGGSSFKLGLGQDVVAVNREMASIARQVAGDKVLVGGSIGPTGKFIQPLGDVSFKEMVQVYMEQIRGLVQGGVDFILGETHFDLAEAKALVIAAHQECDLPVAVSMTFESPTASLTGTSPLTFIDTMQNLGVDMVGTNCSSGPEGLLEVVGNMLPRLDVPVFVEPNAGLPELDENNNTVFRLQPDDFAAQTVKFADIGAKGIGGCCGTTPEHIRALKNACAGKAWNKPEPTDGRPLVLTSRAKSVPIGADFPSRVIGERINPTGKQTLISQLQEGIFDEAMRLAQEQVDANAPILDVNVGAPMVDEAATLPEVVKLILSRFDNPLCIDSTNTQAVENALWTYPGSALVNSISGEPGRMEKLGPICKLHGAPFILLPIKGKKLPVTSAERLAIIEELLEQAYAMGIPKRLIMPDALALTVSSKPLAAKYCFEVIEHCHRQWSLPTVFGLSNISFGLPARELVNSAFLSMCVSKGLSAFIANPNSERLNQAHLAAELLMGRDPQAENFIASYSGWTPGSESGTGQTASGKEQEGEKDQSLFGSVVRGAREKIQELVQSELDNGADPFKLVNEALIPAIMEVGEKYERKEYFLPQLLQSAETLQSAFSLLKPLLEAGGANQDKDVILMATVEGDIHDIGKNIVCLMLKNHGFEVIDLGKDITAEKIVDKVKETGASIVGLSALMTTTMTKMEDTVRLLKEEGLDTKVIVGGAVVTQAFADSIGAHGYAQDAVSAVKVAKGLLQ